MRRLRVHCTPTPARGVAATVVVQEVVEDCPLHAELRLARQTLRSLVDASPVCILTLDLQMNVTMWNPAAEALFGWSAEDVLGRPYPLVPPQERESFKVLFDRVVGGEGFTGVEGTASRE